MANTKISALTSASTPLAGTEVLPIVQSGATVKVAVSNLTAGRAISATSITASTDNFVVGTANKGITDSTGALTSNYNATGITTNGTVSAGHVYRFGTYTAGATTPSVLGVSCMVITNSSPTTITNFTNAVSGQILTLIFKDANTTIARNNAYLSLGLNFTSTAEDTLTLICNGTEWFEVSRSINS